MRIAGNRGKGTPVTTNDTYGEAVGQLPEAVRSSLDEVVRQGAQRMLAAALEAEVASYVERHQTERDQEGRALVVRNGKARTRTIATSAGPLEMRAPRVNDRRPGRRFTSAIVPPYMRRSPRLEEAVPYFYLRGLSTNDIGPALAELFGDAIRGVSPTTVTRLKEVWQEEHKTWSRRTLSDRQYAYLWADGVSFPVRLEHDRLTCLVVVGVTEDGQKEVIALSDGYRESTESWLTVLRDLKDRGLAKPLLAVADGALGFWGALDEVFPGVKHQRCWKHKVANVLDKLPRRLQPAAKDQLHEIMYAPDRATAEAEIERFTKAYEAKNAKAVASLTDHQEELLTFLDFPAEHWVHLRTTNPIESTFGTIKARTSRTRGAGSRKAGLAMAFKLMQAAEERWRRVNAPQLVAAVLAGIEFKDGVRVATSSSGPPQEPVDTGEEIAA